MKTVMFIPTTLTASRCPLRTGQGYCKGKASTFQTENCFQSGLRTGMKQKYSYGINGMETEIRTARSKKAGLPAHQYAYDSRGRITSLGQMKTEMKLATAWTHGDG